MNPIPVTPELSKSIDKITGFYNKINALNVKEWDSLMDRLDKSHPLIISILLGFHASKDFTAGQLSIAVKALATLWLYNGAEKANGLTESDYKLKMKENWDFAEYLSGEHKEDQLKTIGEYLIYNTDSAVMTFLTFVLRENIEYKGISPTEFWRLVVELKSVHDCLEPSKP